jgi:hypothetical protein
VPEQEVLDVLVVIEELSIDSEKTADIAVPREIDVWLSDGEVDDKVGDVLSTENVLIVN